MRTTTAKRRTDQRRYRHRSTMPSIVLIDPTWHARAVSEATAVRRILRSACAGGNGVVGVDATTAALERNSVRQLLFTARFVDLNPAIAAHVEQQFRAGRLTMRTISGVAALDLDLLGEGIAAVLFHVARQAPSRGAEASSHSCFVS